MRGKTAYLYVDKEKMKKESFFKNKRIISNH